jgi:hypothetical protein
MALTTAQKTYFGGSIVVGAVLAVVFSILAAQGDNNQTAYIAAAVASGIAGVVALIVMLVKRG